MVVACTRAGAVNAVTAGGVRSTVTAVPVEADGGPLLPAASLMESAVSVGMTVPSSPDDRESRTVNVLPADDDTLATLQPVDVPPIEMSDVSRPRTGSSNESV